MAAALATIRRVSGPVRVRIRLPEVRFGPSWGLAGAVGLLVVLALGWPALAACSCKGPPRIGYSDARKARNLFIGDVVLARLVRLQEGSEVLAYLVSIRAAWQRALPEYVVVETDGLRPEVGLRVGDRNLFEFKGDGHAGLDRPADYYESDPDGWVWSMWACSRHFDFQRIADVTVGRDGYISYFGGFRRSDSGYPEAYTGRGPWTEPGALREADRREKQLIRELTSILGPPLPAPPRTKVPSFDKFAEAYVGAANVPPWPADWEYAMAAAFQLSHLLGVDHSTDVLISAPHALLPWDRQPPYHEWKLLAQVMEQLAEATFLPRPTAIWQTFLAGLARLVQDLTNRNPGTPNTSRRPHFIQVDMVRSAQLLLRLPRNWRDFPIGYFQLWEVELHNDCRGQSSPSAACIWLNSLAERHQEALHGLGMAYLRQVLATAHVPWVDGKPNAALDGQPPP